MNEEEEFVTPTIGQGDVKQAEKDRTFEGRLGAFNEQSEALKILGSQDRWKTNWNRNLQTNVFGRGPLSPESPLLDDFSNTMESVTGVDPTDPKDIAIEALGFFQEARKIGPTSTVVKRAVVNNADNIPFIKQGIEEASRKLDNWFGARRTKVQTPDGRTFYAAAKDGSDDLSQRMSDAYGKNKKIIKAQEGLPLPRLSGDDILNQIDDAEDLNSLGELLNIKGKDRVTRDRAAALLTGDTVTAAKKAEKSIFNPYVEQIGRTINKLLPKDVANRLWSFEKGNRTVNWHHVGPLKQVASTVNGLAPKYAKIGSDYIADGISRALGNVKGAGTPLPYDFHNRGHGFFNNLAGLPDAKGIRYNVDKHIKALGWGPDWQTTKTLKQRKPLYDLIIKDVIESEDTINTFWRSLNNRAELGKISRKEYLDSTLEVLELDETLAAIHSKKHTSGVTATDIINDILDRSNTALENSVNLVANTDTQSALYRVLLQEQGELALIEAITTNTSRAAVFKKYGINIKNPKVIEKAIQEIDPNVLNEIMPIGDVDTYLRTGWADPRLGSSSLKAQPNLKAQPLRNASDLLNEGWSITDIENARQAGYNINLDL